MKHEMKTPLKEFANDDLYKRYLVKGQVQHRIDGGTPKDPEMIKAWVESRTGYDDEKAQAIIKEHEGDLDGAVEELSEKMWCGFKTDAEHGPYIETRQVKAMLRECCVVLGITKKKRGSRQILQHGFEIKGHEGGLRVYIDGDDPEIEEKAIHVKTMQGPRSAIKKCDYIPAGALFEFEIWVLKTQPAESRHIGDKEIKLMLQLAQDDGLGANRSQSSGKFNVVGFEKLN